MDKIRFVNGARQGSRTDGGRTRSLMDRVPNDGVGKSRTIDLSHISLREKVLKRIMCFRIEEMATKCPDCGAELPATVSACPGCGVRFGRKLAAPPEEVSNEATVQYIPPQRPSSAGRKSSHLNPSRVMLTIVLVVIFTSLSMAYNLGLFDPKPPEPEPEASLSGFFHWSAMGDIFGGGEGGSIFISGDISNSGDVDGSGTVHMRVFDGYSWHDYSKGTGIVPAGGEVRFEYSASFERIIVDDVQVTMSIR